MSAHEKPRRRSGGGALTGGREGGAEFRPNRASMTKMTRPEKTDQFSLGVAFALQSSGHYRIIFPLFLVEFANSIRPAVFIEALIRKKSPAERRGKHIGIRAGS